jgi:rhodanese-related sulfurtransferase
LREQTRIVAASAALRILEAPMTQIVTRNEVQNLLYENEATLVEVLPESVYEKGHLPHALNIPLARLQDEAHSNKLPRGKPIIVYCYDFQ